MVESVIQRKFQSSSRIAEVTEYFQISGDEDGGRLDRAGEVRLLQQLLETSHDIYYRSDWRGHINNCFIVIYQEGVPWSGCGSLTVPDILRDLDTVLILQF